MILNDDILKGVFLLILTISGNYLAETLNCKLQYDLIHNIYIKHLVCYFTLYFAIGVINTDKYMNPIKHFKTAFIIYIYFLLINKMPLNIIYIVFILLITFYIINNFIIYYENISSSNIKKYNNKNVINKLLAIRNIIYYIIIILIPIGFYIYYKKQKTDYSDNWSILKFIFGISNCKSI